MSIAGKNKNNPCPCGSGKKFKKCCNLKSTGWLSYRKTLYKIVVCNTILPMQLAIDVDHFKNEILPLDGDAFYTIIKPIEWYRKHTNITYLHWEEQQLIDAQYRVNGFVGQRNGILFFINADGLTKEKFDVIQLDILNPMPKPYDQIIVENAGISENEVKTPTPPPLP